MNKYEIKYTKDGHWTGHSFDTVKELKNILSDLIGTKVTPMPAEYMPKNMYMLCVEHNEKALSSETYEVAANTSMNLRNANR